MGFVCRFDLFCSKRLPDKIQLLPYMKLPLSLFFSTLLVLFYSCRKSDSTADEGDPAITDLKVISPEPGYIYVNGDYTGCSTPETIPLAKGSYTIGVALQNSYQYLRKTVDLTTVNSVTLTASDKPPPKAWKALWIGLYETKGSTPTGDCSTHFSKNELDLGYGFFTWSIKNHFEKYSYGTMIWEVERNDIEAAVLLKKGSNSCYTVEPEEISKLMPAIQPGVYDCVFVFWRESEGSCDFASNYFGLAWTNPMDEAIKTGYVTVKFNAGTSAAEGIKYYKENDPGVWVHEWLHTVGEKFYQDKGRIFPKRAADGLVVHAGEIYGYKFPWMDWYKDLISGRIPNTSAGPKFLGIAPESFLNCTVRETAINKCHYVESK